MNTFQTRIFGIVGLLMISVSAFAWINPETREKGNTTKNDQVNFREDCVPSETQIFQDINNVRARLLVGGDIWWDGQSEGQYIVPAPAPGSDDPEVSSIFAGGVWLGGVDQSGNLKVAASTYRNPGVDFFPGPLDTDTNNDIEEGQTDLEICRDWDRFYEVLGSDINLAIALYDKSIETGEDLDCDSIPDGLKQWAANGNPYFTDYYPFDLPNTGQGLGAFWDEDGDGYDPCQGDFPIIEIRGCFPETRAEAKELVPDQMIFWIYNDAGAPHGLSRGELQMQMEVQVQSFAYQSNDEVNDMTFMRYKLINRGKDDLRDTYFAMWVDPDLGCSEDDFVGCDVERSLAYTYNEDAVDGDAGTTCTTGALTYGNDVPIIGTDYFRGPLGPKQIVAEGEGELVVLKKSDSFDESVYEVGDTIWVKNIQLGDQNIDVFIELGMSSFMYYNRSDLAPDPATGDPDVAQDYYNYLQSIWIDGTPLTYGGSGYNPGSQDSINFAFPSDPNKATVNDWSMCTANLPFGDRRTLQASGPFILKPNATNELIVGAVWVPNLNYPCPDISRLQKADDLAQALFDNCFNFIDGPDAPDVSIIELDRELILVLTNDEVLSNNSNLGYEERDIFAADSIVDPNYEFEGYRIYQLVNANVSASEYDDIEKAVEIAQVDIKNGITKLYNWDSFKDPNDQVEATFYTFEEMVDGADAGVSTTFQVVTDRFADGDARLVNHKPYYFSAVAYGSNNHTIFDPQTGLGQATTYLEGRRNIQSYTGVPRPIVYDNLNAAYGDGPVITRLDGAGSPGVFLELDDTMYDEIIANNSVDRLVYRQGAGPIDVNVYNPLEVVDGIYSLEILGDFDEVTCGLEEDATWRLTNIETGQIVTSKQPISEVKEQIVPEFGFSMNINQVGEPGTVFTEDNGTIGTSLEYANPNGINWFNAVQDDDTRFNGDGLFGLDRVFNFIATRTGEIDEDLDRPQAFSGFGNRFFYPMFLADGSPRAEDLVTVHVTPAFNRGNLHSLIRGTGSDNGLDRLNNVDIVFTSDKSKWSRCIVVETASEDYTAGGEQTTDGRRMLEMRTGASIDQNGSPDGDGTGMSWFPGYAVDVETGKRLNIFFGENSIYDQDYVDAGFISSPYGADMMWNPTSDLIIPELITGDTPTSLEAFVVGGNQFFYVSRTEYDGCNEIRNLLSSANPVQIAQVFKSVTWACMPIMPTGVSLNSYADGVIPNDLTAKIRVQNPYNLERLFDIDDLLGCTTDGGNPKYEFEIRGLQTTELTSEEVDDVLSNVRAVPNPYYGFSSYEGSQFTTEIKITNLPARADVTIYTLDGKFVRQFNRDEQISVNPIDDGVKNTQIVPDLEWDLKNYAGIPVASGVYLIHINAIDLGTETTIKWFGVNRKFDPSGL